MIPINLLINHLLIDTQNIHPLINQIIQRTSALQGTTVLFYLSATEAVLLAKKKMIDYSNTVCYIFLQKNWRFCSHNWAKVHNNDSFFTGGPLPFILFLIVLTSRLSTAYLRSNEMSLGVSIMTL